MRSIFFRLLLSFFLTILLTGVISGLVMFSLSRRSVDSFRHNFLQQLQNNIARSTVLMGQAAYIMRQHRGDEAFVKYIDEIHSSMRTQLYLRIDGTILPSLSPLDRHILSQVDTADLSDQPFIADDGRQLTVAQRLQSPEGKEYLVIGLHRLGPPPGMEGPPPPPPHGRESSFRPFWGWDKGVRLFVFLPVAGVICYLLARSFSAPLGQLRRISRQIAAGDLSARVGTNLAKPGNEIGDLARDFDHMAERMEGLVNGQKRLLQDISHELRSPLARLNLALELAKKRFHAEEDDILARIGRESDRLNTLIGQLLTLTRSEAFVIDRDTPRVDLTELISEIAEDVGFETSDQQKQVEFRDMEPLAVTGSEE
ncbi:MAG: histidine kinase dimerization/phospho-acceptor domain-containing protein, partial [Desulfobulbus sp.]